jgi:hypothetical protein
MIRRSVLLSVLMVVSAMTLVAQDATTAAQSSSTTTQTTAQPTTIPKPATDVNVVNTPTVQLAGTSTVQVSGTTNVKVQNDSTSPIPVQDVSGKKRVPFQINQSFPPTPFADPTQFEASVPVTVPAGKKLTIEHVSVRAETPFGAQTPTFVFSISTTVGGVTVRHFLDVPQAFAFGCGGCLNGTHSYNLVSQEMKLYADPGPTIQVIAQFIQPGNGNTFDINFAISGFLEDAP